jgi:hypothetical protein
MPATVAESQGKMSNSSASWFLRRRAGGAVALAAALCLSGAGAQAQSNPFRAVTDWMGVTTEAVEGPDFVRQTRPDLDKTGYSNLTGVDKKRVPVRTPAEVAADKAELIADREKAAARMKKLGAEKMDPVAPAKAPPVTDEKF